MRIETGDPRWPETEHRIYRVSLQKGELRGDLRFTSPERPFHVANTSCFLLLLVSLVIVVAVVAFLAFSVIRGSSKFRRWVILLQFSPQFQRICETRRWIARVQINPRLWKLSARSLMWVFLVIIEFHSGWNRGVVFSFSYSFIIFPTSFWL